MDMARRENFVSYGVKAVGMMGNAIAKKDVSARTWLRFGAGIEMKPRKAKITKLAKRGVGRFLTKDGEVGGDFVKWRRGKAIYEVNRCVKGIGPEVKGDGRMMEKGVCSLDDVTMMLFSCAIVLERIGRG